MNKQDRMRMMEALEKCEMAKEKIEKTQGYCEESKYVRLLTEIIKENYPNENSSRSAIESR